MRDDDRYWDSQNNRYTQLAPGTVISVRPNESIDVERKDNRVYAGIVDQDVRGSNGRLAIPRGSRVELIVRVERDNDLNLDLESVTVNGHRYAIRTDNNHVESARDNSLVGAIVGAISGGQARGRAIRIPRDAVLTFRLQRPLEVGVADRGVTRDGSHYHDYYDHDR
jgi:outer membrane lipoprotein SlyB